MSSSLQGIFGLLSAVNGLKFFHQCYNPLGDFMDAMALINSAINFILYCFMSKQFRKTFVETFRLQWCTKRWNRTAGPCLKTVCCCCGCFCCFCFRSNSNSSNEDAKWSNGNGAALCACAENGSEAPTGVSVGVRKATFRLRSRMGWKNDGAEEEIARDGVKAANDSNAAADKVVKEAAIAEEAEDEHKETAAMLPKPANSATVENSLPAHNNSCSKGNSSGVAKNSIGSSLAAQNSCGSLAVAVKNGVVTQDVDDTQL